MPGRQLRLTLDLDVQKAGQDALGGAKGAFVVMDVKTGAIRALGSSPSFNPNVFSKQIRQKDFKRLTDQDNGAPLANRAMQGLYPTGSIFKLITSVAGLESGLITPGTRHQRPRLDPDRQRHLQERRQRRPRRGRAAQGARRSRATSTTT